MDKPVFGKKTTNTSYDELNKKQLIIHLRNEFSELLNDYTGELMDDITCDSIKDKVSDILLDLENRGILNTPSVDCGLEMTTWRGIYGWKFLWAIFFKKVISKIFKISLHEFVHYPKWYHKLFLFEIHPININKYLINLLGDKFVDSNDEENPDISWYDLQEFLLDEDNKINNKQYYVKFQSPDIYIKTDISFRPIKNVENVKMSIELK